MEGVDWVYLAVVRDRWMSVVCMVMTIDHLSKCQLPERKSAPWSLKNKPGIIALKPDVTHNTYLNMWRGAKDIQNARSNVFWLQIRTLFQKFFRNRFGLHQSRTDTLQQEEC